MSNSTVCIEKKDRFFPLENYGRCAFNLLLHFHYFRYQAHSISPRRQVTHSLHFGTMYIYIYIYTFILHFFDPCHHLSPHHITNAYLLQCHQLPEDFVRNFLFRHGLQRTFDMFQQEWYEQTSQDLVASSSEPTPDIYTINQSVRFMLRDYLHFRYPSPCLSSRTLLPPHFLGHDLDGRRASISTCTGRRLP